MSTRKGAGNTRTRKPAHQNAFAFRHNPKSKKTAKIMASPNTGLCASCHDKVEWRKKYRKYKPLRQPATCQGCHEKTVTAAYHKLCQACAKDHRVCPFCRTKGRRREDGDGTASAGGGGGRGEDGDGDGSDRSSGSSTDDDAHQDEDTGVGGKMGTVDDAMLAADGNADSACPGRGGKGGRCSRIGDAPRAAAVVSGAPIGGESPRLGSACNAADPMDAGEDA